MVEKRSEEDMKKCDVVKLIIKGKKSCVAEP